MAVGWANEESASQEADARISSIVSVARKKCQGVSLKFCVECDEEIPKARRDAMQGITHCITCQSNREKK